MTSDIESEKLTMEKIAQKQKWMKILFVLSSIFLAIASFLILIQFILSLSHSNFPIQKLEFLRQYLNSSSIKNIATTVGLTGIIFTWLLQIIGDTECSQRMSTLYTFVFDRYVLQLAIYIISLLFCIGFSSPQYCTIWDLLISSFSFLTVILGMSSMWILCSLFLFSEKERRNIAFLYLKHVLSTEEKKELEAKRTAYLSDWGKEIPRCIMEDDTEHVMEFFNYFVAEKKNRDPYIEVWYRIMYNIVKNTEPDHRKLLPDYIFSAGLEDDDLIFLLTLYIIAIYDLFPKEYKEQSVFESDLYKYLWHYQLDASFDIDSSSKQDVVHHRYYVYCSLVAVLYGMDRRENTTAIRLLKHAYKRIDSHGSCDHNLYINTIETVICSRPGYEKDEQRWREIQNYYKVLVNFLIHPV